MHFLEWSLSLARLDLSRTRSHAEVLSAAAGAAAGANGWLIGAGWRTARWPAGDPEPHREALDAACGDRPVLLWAHDHHTAWLSSAALALLPVGAAPVVERDAAGEPTGCCARPRPGTPPPPSRRRARASSTRRSCAACARPTRAA